MSWCSHPEAAHSGVLCAQCESREREARGGSGWGRGVPGGPGLNRRGPMMTTDLSYFTRATTMNQFVPFHRFNAFLAKERLFVKAFKQIAKHKGMKGPGEASHP